MRTRLTGFYLQFVYHKVYKFTFIISSWLSWDFQINSFHLSTIGANATKTVFKNCRSLHIQLLEHRLLFLTSLFYAEALKRGTVDISFCKKNWTFSVSAFQYPNDLIRYQSFTIFLHIFYFPKIVYMQPVNSIKLLNN
jgi:hypothetical protein